MFPQNDISVLTSWRLKAAVSLSVGLVTWKILLDVICEHVYKLCLTHRNNKHSSVGAH